MEIFFVLFIVTILILLNGGFVAAEFALLSVPRTIVNKLALQGNSIAKRLQKIQQNPKAQDRYYSTTQLGITAASLGLGMFGEHSLAEWLAQVFQNTGIFRDVLAHSVASMAVIVVLTYFHIVVGEMMPKTIALQNHERTAFWLAFPMQWLEVLFYPVVLLLSKANQLILRTMGINRQVNSGFYHTTEELQFIVRESEESGVLKKEAGQVIRELFEFSDLTVSELQVPRVRINGLPVDASPDEIKEILKKNLHTRYPVYKGDMDHILGMVHIKDLLRILMDNRSLTKEDLREVPYISSAADVDSALAAMRQTRTHMAIVMDEQGGTSGIITVGDLFEEVVGTLEEEGREEAEIFTDEQGVIHARGTTRLEKVGEYINTPLIHEDVDTLSGLVLLLLATRPPEVGDIVTYNEVTFKVTAIAGHGVQECSVTPPPLP